MFERRMSRKKVERIIYDGQRLNWKISDVESLDTIKIPLGLRL